MRSADNPARRVKRAPVVVMLVLALAGLLFTSSARIARSQGERHPENLAQLIEVEESRVADAEESVDCLRRSREIARHGVGDDLHRCEMQQRERHSVQRLHQGERDDRGGLREHAPAQHAGVLLVADEDHPFQHREPGGYKVAGRGIVQFSDQLVDHRGVVGRKTGNEKLSGTPGMAEPTIAGHRCCDECEGTPREIAPHRLRESNCRTCQCGDHQAVPVRQHLVVETGTNPRRAAHQQFLS